MAGTVVVPVRRLPRGLRGGPRTRTPIVIRPLIVNWGRRHAAARGLYRVFGLPGFRFYRSSLGPPAETDAFFATSSALPATPGTTFADGTWYVSVSYFDGVLDSGFLPIGPNGQAYVLLVVASGGSGSVPPSAPLTGGLQALAGGVVRVIALYAETGTNRADTWSISYTTNGSAPTPGVPTATRAFASTSAPQALAFNLPAQAAGTVVQVLVQTRRGSVYSTPGAVVSIVAVNAGPSGIPGGDAWRGSLPEGTD